MEYYYLNEVGILNSFKANDEETLLSLLNDAYSNHRENFSSVLREHDIVRCFTFVAPKFKYKFELQDDVIVTTYRND